jgi:hypothetical protein
MSSTTLPLRNPYGLAEGAPCYQILIEYAPHLNKSTAEHAPYKQAIAVPMAEAAYHPDPIEGAATLAYLWAKEHDGLQAGMMVFCLISYYDEELQGWVVPDWE